MIYSHVAADGRITPVESEGPLPLERLQELVGGYIEFVWLPDGTTACVNEERLVIGLNRNAAYPDLCGDVVLGRMVATKDGDEFVGIL